MFFFTLRTTRAILRRLLQTDFPIRPTYQNVLIIAHSTDSTATTLLIDRDVLADHCGYFRNLLRYNDANRIQYLERNHGILILPPIASRHHLELFFDRLNTYERIEEWNLFSLGQYIDMWLLARYLQCVRLQNYIMVMLNLEIGPRGENLPYELFAYAWEKAGKESKLVKLLVHTTATWGTATERGPVPEVMWEVIQAESDVYKRYYGAHNIWFEEEELQIFLED